MGMVNFRLESGIGAENLLIYVAKTKCAQSLSLTLVFLAIVFTTVATKWEHNFGTYFMSFQ